MVTVLEQVTQAVSIMREKVQTYEYKKLPANVRAKTVWEDIKAILPSIPTRYKIYIFIVVLGVSALAYIGYQFTDAAKMSSILNNVTLNAEQKSSAIDKLIGKKSIFDNISDTMLYAVIGLAILAIIMYMRK